MCSFHGSCPVLRGEKWSATKWIHVGTACLRIWTPPSAWQAALPAAQCMGFLPPARLAGASGGVPACLPPQAAARLPCTRASQVAHFAEGGERPQEFKRVIYAPPPPPLTPGCKDLHASCSAWAEEGECARNAGCVVQWGWAVVEPSSRLPCRVHGASGRAGPSIAPLTTPPPPPAAQVHAEKLLCLLRPLRPATAWCLSGRERERERERRLAGETRT
jgi:hypothetical protein